MHAAGKRADDGYAAIALEDSNHDGKLNSSDAHWGELQLWVDANRNGKTDPGELHSLAEFGIVELDLAAREGTDIDNGNLIGLVSSFTKADGSQHVMADVWFARDVAPEQAPVPTPATLGELLSTPAADLLPAPAGPPAPADAAPGIAPVLPRASIDDERPSLPLI